MIKSKLQVQSVNDKIIHDFLKWYRSSNIGLMGYSNNKVIQEYKKYKSK